MHSPALQCLLAVIVLLPWTPAQTTQDGKPKQAPWTMNTKDQIARLQREILGSWQLIDFVNEERSIPSGSAVGYALFMDGYMSLEAHVESTPVVADVYSLHFQSGTYRWRFNELAELDTSTLIGLHNIPHAKGLMFEEPGTRRTFTVSLVGDELTLERVGPNGHTRLILQRLGKLPFPDPDVELAFPKKNAPGKSDKK